MPLESPTLAASAEIERSRRGALSALLKALELLKYRFVTTTPSSHERVLSRSNRREARSLRDVMGWSLPFAPGMIPSEIVDLLRAGGVLQERPDGLLASNVRASSLGDTLFLHSAYPTIEQDAVFFGPDSYRFADLIAARMQDLAPGARILDYAAGSGVGGITAAMRQRHAHLTLADINPQALFLASINAEHAGLRAETLRTTSPADPEGLFDLIVTHPPFMIDEKGRAYRDGGDLYGARLSLDWALAGARKLAKGGRLILHTGVSIVEGLDVLKAHLEEALPALGCHLWYHELDPDIFGEELGNEAYVDVERIAAVGACITRVEER
ncbi:MAG: hypothetical protein K0R64_1704 [Novosphingobium lindaniclasticum]|uniref:methyltransferase n=1 Tax=Novosphingobium lindaniclasticum TaxID=1329895 RepID=UPI002408F2ED|nr:methyltransferase [Novosphingobium lindaniclasticum]MDF2638720.1 hypothetical protein [Novosphingobium lindaniclasticum]